MKRQVIAARHQTPRRLGQVAARLGAAVTIACLCLLPAACDKFRPGGEGEGDTDEAPQPRAPVIVEWVKRGAIESALSAASTIEAERQVTVHAESTGRIMSFSLEEGDKLKAGKGIARIKYDAQAARLDRAATSLDKAKSDLDVVKKLHAQGVASKDELTAAELAYKTATLDVKDSRRDVGNTRVTAPFAGTVTQRFVTEGAFVSAGAQLLTITDFSTLVARVYVPEKELDRIAVGQDAVIVGKAARSRRGTGTVKRIAPIVDAATGTVKVTVGLPAQLVGGKTGFLPGMYAEVRLTTERREDVVLVSKRALIRDDDEAFVFVTAGDAVKRVRVELGLADDDKAEVLSGLSAGDEVVVSGQAGLKDGGLIDRVDPTGKPVEAGSAPSDSLAAAEGRGGA